VRFRVDNTICTLSIFDRVRVMVMFSVQVQCSISMMLIKLASAS